MRAPLALGLAAIGVLVARRVFASTERGAPLVIGQVPASHYTPAKRVPPDVRLLIIHTTQAPKTNHTARDVATNWTALPTTQVSAHYIVDDENIVQTVAEHDVAWQARGGDANARGIGIEHAGSAGQSAASWGDAFNTKMLALSAELAAAICARWNIPVVWLSAADVAAGKRGITGHREISDAYNVPNGHGDPGAGFPRAHYIDLVRAAS